MNWIVFVAWLKVNLNWIIPSTTSLFFAIVTTVLIFKQAKWQRDERKINVEMMLHQSNLQEAQLCIGLAAERLKIFQAIIDVFRDVIRDGEANRQLIQRFRANTFGIDFYFGDDVIAFHKKIETAIHDLAYVSMKVNDVINGRREHADHEENVDKQSKLLDEVLNLNNELFSVFKPYLDFSNYKVRK